MTRTYTGNKLPFSKIHHIALESGLSYREVMLYSYMTLFADPQTGKGKYSDDSTFTALLKCSQKTLNRYFDKLIKLNLIELTKSKSKRAYSRFKLLLFDSYSNQHVQVRADVILSQSLTLLEKAVYIATKKFENGETGEAYPEVSNIRRLLKARKQSVLDAYHKLDELNVISIRKKSVSKNNRAVKHIYIFNDVADSLLNVDSLSPEEQISALLNANGENSQKNVFDSSVDSASNSDVNLIAQHLQSLFKNNGSDEHYHTAQLLVDKIDHAITTDMIDKMYYYLLYTFDSTLLSPDDEFIIADFVEAQKQDDYSIHFDNELELDAEDMLYIESRIEAVAPDISYSQLDLVARQLTNSIQSYFDEYYKMRVTEINVTREHIDMFAEYVIENNIELTDHASVILRVFADVMLVNNVIDNQVHSNMIIRSEKSIEAA